MDLREVFSYNYSISINPLCICSDSCIQIIRAIRIIYIRSSGNRLLRKFIPLSVDNGEYYISFRNNYLYFMWSQSLGCYLACSIPVTAMPARKRICEGVLFG